MTVYLHFDGVFLFYQLFIFYLIKLIELRDKKHLMPPDINNYTNYHLVHKVS